MTDKSKYILLIAFGAFCISFSPILVKLIPRNEMGPTVIGFWRMLFGSGFLFAWIILRRKELLLPFRVMRWIILAGFFFCYDLFFWHRSVIYAGAGMSTILGNTQVFISAILGVMIFKEKLTPRFVISAVAGIVGMIFLVGIGSDVEFTTVYTKGVIFGFLTGICYGCYIVSLKYAGHRVKGSDIVIMAAWAAVFSSGWLLGTAGIEQASLISSDPTVWLLLLGLGFIVQMVGWLSITTSLPHLETSRSGLILLIQPVLATVWGAIIFAEELTWIQIAGAVVLLTAIYVGSVYGVTKVKQQPAQ